jgi:hypothetical protein
MSERENTQRMTETPSVELHIEELLLRGFNPHDRMAISDAVERELARLIVNGGIAGIGGEMAIERLDGGRFKVAPGMRPGAVGRQIAQTLYRGMSPAKPHRGIQHRAGEANQVLPQRAQRSEAATKNPPRRHGGTEKSK